MASASTAVAGGPHGLGSFYDAHHSSSAEAARLRGMAGAADRLTLTALAGVVDRPGLVVTDVGCGDSFSLGTTLAVRNPSLTYVPVDIRPQAVDVHRQWGFDGRLGSVTDLPIDDGAVNVFHARFVFGWLDAAGRRRAVEEMLRVSAGAARSVIIDYDWSSAAGPDVVVAWKEKILQLLSAFGFDPTYGKRLASDVHSHLADAGLEPFDYSLAEVRSTATEPMRDALETIAELVESLLDRLDALGLDEDALELRSLHAAVVAHGHRHPRAAITFPTMVAVAIDLTEDVALAAATTAIAGRRSARRRADLTSGLQHAGPPQLGVFVLESDDLIDQARRLQAAEYITHGHHTEDSVDADGFLITQIDPPEVVARSRYLGVVDDEGVVVGCIRMIRPAAGNPLTLPTLGKLLGQREHGEAMFAGLPFDAEAAFFEASGLAKSSRCSDRAATTRLLLAIFSEAHRFGDDYGIMGVVTTTARLLAAVYGHQAIRRLDATAGTISVAGTGITAEGLTLVPCYSQTTTFLGDCLQHCQTRPKSEFSRLIRPLVELTAAAIAA